MRGRPRDQALGTSNRRKLGAALGHVSRCRSATNGISRRTRSAQEADIAGSHNSRENFHLKGVR
jgi:hypothetical protein